MLAVTGEDGHARETTNPSWSSRHEAAVTTAQNELAINTLMNFPTARMCEVLVEQLPFMDDIWLSQIMIRHCLTQIWTEYGEHLAEQRRSDSISQMASNLTDNTRPVIRFDEHDQWHNWFSGPHIRWEMVGMVFAFAGFACKHLQEWDSFFHLPEVQGMNRTTAADKMRECAHACIQLCNDTETSDLLVVLMKNVTKLQSMVVHDESECKFSIQLVIHSYLAEGHRRQDQHRLRDGNELRHHGGTSPFTNIQRSNSIKSIPNESIRIALLSR